MPAQSTPSTARTIRHCLFLVLFSLIVLAPGIAGLPATDRDESRYLQATKQMVASGDYVDIRFKDEPRYRKPAGIYWMQSAALLLSGDGENAPIWVNRSVSVASGIVAVVALYLLTASLFGARAGLIAGLGLAGIFMLGFEARIAKTDAALLAATLVAQAGLALVYVAARTGKATNPWHAWMFWIGLGAGMMIKGPITPGVAGLTILALALNDRFDIRWLETGIGRKLGVAVGPSIADDHFGRPSVAVSQHEDLLACVQNDVVFSRTQPVESGYMGNAWVWGRHPDYDLCKAMLEDVGRTIKVWAE